MTNKGQQTPRSYQGVMVSSTFTDVSELREILMKALRQEQLFPIGMEDHVARIDDDVVQEAVREKDGNVANLFNNLGTIQDTLGEHPKAIEFYNKARLATVRTIPDCAVTSTNVPLRFSIK